MVLIKEIHKKKNSEEIVCIALREPGIAVVATGPPACIRILYFRAMANQLLENFYAFPLDENDLINASYQAELEDFIAQIITEKPEVKGIIIYTSCPEVLSGMSYERIIKEIFQKYGKKVRVFKRGPLEKRIKPPKEKLKEIFNDFKEND